MGKNKFTQTNRPNVQGQNNQPQEKQQQKVQTAAKVVVKEQALSEVALSYISQEETDKALYLIGVLQEDRQTLFDAKGETHVYDQILGEAWELIEEDESNQMSVEEIAAWKAAQATEIANLEAMATQLLGDAAALLTLEGPGGERYRALLEAEDPSSEEPIYRIASINEKAMETLLNGIIAFVKSIPDSSFGALVNAK